MRYWLMWSSIHGTEIQLSGIGVSWPYTRVRPNERLRAGDFVYLIKNRGEVYSFGHVQRIEPYFDQELNQDLWRVYVSRQELRHEIIPAERMREHPVLSRLYENMNSSLVLLTIDDAKIINQLLSGNGVRPPADPIEEEPPIVINVQAPALKPERRFILNRPVSDEERRYAEFKEIRGTNPVDSIKNTADEYAVALLNKEGGSIFWGIRDSDRVVVGVQLNYQQRDEIRRTVSNKLGQIQPHFPIALFNLDFHSVCDENGEDLEELWIFQADIPSGLPTELYATGSGEVHVKTDGGKQKLNYLQMVAEIAQRKGGQRTETSDPDENIMFAIVADLTRRARANAGDAWFPEPGSDDHRLAEKMVSRNMLERLLRGVGGYVLPGRINPDAFGGKKF